MRRDGAAASRAQSGRASMSSSDASNGPGVPLQAPVVPARVPRLLFADPSGKVMEHPTLLPTLRSGEELIPPRDRPIPLPPRATLAHLPGRLPVGLDPRTG